MSRFSYAPAPVSRLREEMDRMFSGLVREAVGMTDGSPAVGGFPALCVWEDKDNLYAEAEVPGLSMEAIDVLVKGDELTISGARADEPVEGAAYHRRERGVGKFRRSLRLPVAIAADKVEARLCDGVLTLTLPKAEEAKPRKIEVKVG